MTAGGKGANQAFATARLCGSVTFIANVGHDLFGKQAIEQFKNEKIITSFVTTDPNLPSGAALINVDKVYAIYQRTQSESKSQRWYVGICFQIEATEKKVIFIHFHISQLRFPKINTLNQERVVLTSTKIILLF